LTGKISRRARRVVAKRKVGIGDDQKVYLLVSKILPSCSTNTCRRILASIFTIAQISLTIANKTFFADPKTRFVVININEQELA